MATPMVPENHPWPDRSKENHRIHHPLRLDHHQSLEESLTLERTLQELPVAILAIIGEVSTATPIII